MPTTPWWRTVGRYRACINHWSSSAVVPYFSCAAVIATSLVLILALQMSPLLARGPD
jgi:hypothetical protein